MPTIYFHHKDGTVKSIDAKTGLSIMEVAVKNKIAGIEGACGGSLACATCHIYVHPDWWDKVLPDYVVGVPSPSKGEGQGGGQISDDENDMLDLAFDLRKNSRLSCQIIVRDELDGLILALPGSKPGW